MSEHPTGTAAQTQGESAAALLGRKPALAIGLGAMAIVVLTFAAYLPAIRGQFIWDDDYYVTSNPLIRTFGGLQRIWFDILPSPANYPLPQYYPMTHTSFWLEYKLWGLNPSGYHVVNVLLHVANALLIWLILRKLDVPGAWVAAAIFAVHPINVESVAWIAERKNVLSGFFFFAALYVYLRFAGLIAGPEKPDEYLSLPKEPERVWGLAFVLFFFALTSKTIACSLPAVVLLIYWWKRGRIVVYEKDESEKMGFRSDIVPLLPFFALGLLAAWLTGWMEVHRVGAQGPEWELSIGQRILIAGRALWFYVWKLLVPYPLMFSYPRWEITTGSPMQWLFPMAAIAVLAALWHFRGRIGRGPLVGALYFAGTLLPALGFFKVFPHRYSFVADHFVYLSSIGLIALGTAVVVRVCARYLPREAVEGGVPAAVGAGVLAIFFLLSVVHATVFQSSKSLWEHTLENNKASWFAANNYGVWIRDESRTPDKLDKAQIWFQRTIDLRKDHPEARFNLAIIEQRRGNLPRAEAYFRRAIELRPNYGQAHYELGQLLYAQNRIPEAMEHFQAAIDIDPQRADLARNALGYILMKQAQVDRQAGREKEAAEKSAQAIQHFIAALDANPHFIAARNHLGLALVDIGRIDEAVAEWGTALELDPTNAEVMTNLGQLMVRMERLQEAGMWFERAVRANPKSVTARVNMATAAAMIGRTDIARQQLAEALRIDPENAFAKQKLADLEAGRLKPPATTQSSTMPTTAVGL